MRKNVRVKMSAEQLAAIGKLAVGADEVVQRFLRDARDDFEDEPGDLIDTARQMYGTDDINVDERHLGRRLALGSCRRRLIRPPRWYSGCATTFKVV